MNRSSSKLKPLAMKLEAPQLGGGFHGSKCQQSALESKNKNAFAGSHLGVPAGPLENVTSMDPRDYVWGVPQTQPGLYSTGPLPHGFYAPSQSLPPAVHHSVSQVQYTGCNAAARTETGVPASLGEPLGRTPEPGLPSVPTSAALLAGRGSATGTDVPQLLNQTAAALQATEHHPFEDVDDLLNIPFEDDCLKKLLSDDTNSSGQEGFALQDKDLASGSSDTSRVHFASGGEGVSQALAMLTETSSALSDPLDAMHPLEDPSPVLQSGSDPSAHILDLDMPAEAPGVQHFPPASDAHKLKRARSEMPSGCGLQPGDAYNPLLQLKVEDALATINSYLSSDINVTGHISAEALKAAQAAINKLQSAASAPPGAAASLGSLGPLTSSPAPPPHKLAKSNSFPKRRNSARLASGS